MQIRAMDSKAVILLITLLTVLLGQYLEWGLISKFLEKCSLGIQLQGLLHILTFIINGRNGDSLQSLTIPKASLVGEQLNSSADGALKLTLNYIGHS